MFGKEVSAADVKIAPPGKTLREMAQEVEEAQAALPVEDKPQAEPETEKKDDEATK